MPVSTQCLYFHLGLHADDDGVVEAYTIMNVVGATEDDLKILVAKNFVNVLNEDLVTYITDWRENNKIRADRKVDSIYKDLLIQVIPDIEILGKKPRADRQPKMIDNNGTSQGQPMDGIGKVRLGKDSIGKNSIPTEDKNVNECADNEKLSSMSKLYQENIGMANGIVAEWLIEISEQIDIDLFKRGLEICTERGNTTLGYLKGIIKKWLNNNITTLEQLKSYELQNKKYSTNSVSQNQENIQKTVTKDETDDPEFQRMLAEMNKKQEELNRMTFGGEIDE